MIKTYGTRNYSRSRIRDVHITRSKTYVEHETTQEVEIRERCIHNNPNQT